MIRVLILDDEPLALRQLEAYIEKTPSVRLEGACRSAAEARALLAEKEIDALFADIEMPDLSGLAFVRSLPAPPLVVFTTAHAAYAVEGFRVNAVDYLLKPFGLSEFQSSCRRLEERLAQQRAAGANPVSREEDALFFKMDYKTVRVAFDDIRYVESMSEYIKVHLVSQPVPLVILYSLKRLAERLPEGRFLRIHRSYLINLSRLVETGRGTVVLDDASELPVGDLYRPALKAYLASRL